ncbi:hypothetical protein NK6_6388 [Bradyrhizobium diazoefficiens]|uniref:Uncharacterized protein n=1 Tax=Bradyrhizobium diazoefficiens TaxID=1355477 RepID=A0A0E4G012_9BRAD|nr:hypothetical protein NK6_6388 [Bradyrhizobium diazoefficiens]
MTSRNIAVTTISFDAAKDRSRRNSVGDDPG